MDVQIDSSFEQRFHPTWAIERLLHDSAGLVPDAWFDHVHDTLPYGFDPLIEDDIKELLTYLRGLMPDDRFRMVMRVEVQKVLDI